MEGTVSASTIYSDDKDYLTYKNIDEHNELSDIMIV